MVHLYDNRLECFLGSTQLLTLRRGRAQQGSNKHGQARAAFVCWPLGEKLLLLKSYSYLLFDFY